MILNDLLPKMRMGFKESEVSRAKHEEQLELWKKYKTGDKKALGKLINSLSPLIESNVQKYVGAPIPKSALWAEGVKLTIQALDSYSPEMGTNIATHVSNYLKKLYRFVGQYQNVGRIPEHRISKISVLKEAMDRLQDELGREPTVEELADDLKWPITEVERLKREIAKDLLVPDITPTDSYTLTQYFDVSSPETNIAFFYTNYLDPEEQRLFERLVGFGRPREYLSSIAREEAKRLKKPEDEVYRMLYSRKQKIEEKLDKFLNG